MKRSYHTSLAATQFYQLRDGRLEAAFFNIIEGNNKPVCALQYAVR